MADTLPTVRLAAVQAALAEIVHSSEFSRAFHAARLDLDHRPRV